MQTTKKKPGPKPGSRKTPGSGRRPGSKNKHTPEVKLIAQQYGEEALATLARIMRSSENDGDRIAATKEILNRGYGRSIAQTNIAGWNGGPLSIDMMNNMPAQDLDALIVKLAELAAVKPTEH
jgi:hypothetical protein